jgi:hypothetical protein
LSPQGDWIILVSEIPGHPPWGNPGQANLNFEEYNGWWGDLWVAKPDGQRWYDLTNLTIPTPAVHAVGTLAPKLSPDETKIVSASLVGGTTLTQPLGTWRLMIAVFVVTNGVPSLM